MGSFHGSQGGPQGSAPLVWEGFSEVVQHAGGRSRPNIYAIRPTDSPNKPMCRSSMC